MHASAQRVCSTVVLAAVTSHWIIKLLKKCRNAGSSSNPTHYACIYSIMVHSSKHLFCVGFIWGSAGSAQTVRAQTECTCHADVRSGVGVAGCWLMMIYINCVRICSFV